MKTLLRWLKFNAVGAIGILVQLGVLAALVSGFGAPVLFATALAVEAAVLHNFLWHERFTWADRASVTRAQSFMRLLRFNATTGAVSILSNVVLMRVLAGRLGLPYLPANLLAIAATSLLNFLLADRFVFAGRAANRGDLARRSRKQNRTESEPQRV